MNRSRFSVKTKLALRLFIAMAILAGTRGLGLIQLVGYLERMSGYAVSLDKGGYDNDRNRCGRSAG
jgi:hypothetical protein